MNLAAARNPGRIGSCGRASSIERQSTLGRVLVILSHHCFACVTGGFCSHPPPKARKTLIWSLTSLALDAA